MAGRGKENRGYGNSVRKKERVPNFLLFSHPWTLFLPIKRFYSQMMMLPPCAVKYSKHKRRPRPSPSDVVGINLKNALIQILKEE